MKFLVGYQILQTVEVDAPDKESAVEIVRNQLLNTKGLINIVVAEDAEINIEENINNHEEQL